MGPLWYDRRGDAVRRVGVDPPDDDRVVGAQDRQLRHVGRVADRAPRRAVAAQVEQLLRTRVAQHELDLVGQRGARCARSSRSGAARRDRRTRRSAPARGPPGSRWRRTGARGPGSSGRRSCARRPRAARAGARSARRTDEALVGRQHLVAEVLLAAPPAPGGAVAGQRVADDAAVLEDLHARPRAGGCRCRRGRASSISCSRASVTCRRSRQRAPVSAPSGSAASVLCEPAPSASVTVDVAGGQRGLGVHVQALAGERAGGHLEEVPAAGHEQRAQVAVPGGEVTTRRRRRCATARPTNSSASMRGRDMPDGSAAPASGSSRPPAARRRSAAAASRQRGRQAEELVARLPSGGARPTAPPRPPSRRHAA